MRHYFCCMGMRSVCSEVDAIFISRWTAVRSSDVLDSLHRVSHLPLPYVCAGATASRDLIGSLGVVPFSPRMQAVLILCRGLFTPGYNSAASRVYDSVHGAALRREEGGYSLAGAFAEVTVTRVGVEGHTLGPKPQPFHRTSCSERS